MKHLKPDADPRGMRPELLDAILHAQAVYLENGQEFVITSLNDGKHSRLSMHYQGKAVDLRTRNLNGITPHNIAALIKARLGDGYDVLVESTHIHIEWDPK